MRQGLPVVQKTKEEEEEEGASAAQTYTSNIALHGRSKGRTPPAGLS